MTTAQALIELIPGLGRFMAVRLRETGDEEVTLMQIGVLMRIKEQSITTSDLARQRKVSLQAASVLVQGLVDRGWLTRVPDPVDRRRALLQVTPEGAAHAQAIREQMAQLLAEVLTELSTEEIKAAATLLPALQRIVASHMRPPEASDI